MNLVYQLKASELDEKWCEDVRSKFPLDAWLKITISGTDEVNVDKVLSLADSIDDDSAAEVKQVIDQEFGNQNKE
jgi:hypothetical protein